MKQKVLELLKQESQGYDAIAIPQSIIASKLNTSRQTVNKCIKELYESGSIGVFTVGSGKYYVIKEDDINFSDLKVRLILE